MSEEPGRSTPISAELSSLVVVPGGRDVFALVAVPDCATVAGIQCWSNDSLGIVEG